MLRLCSCSVWLAAAFASAALHAPAARANGRMPGATEFALSRSDPDHLLTRATFGLVQSFDGGDSWQWICEQAVNVSGEADPPLAVAEGSGLVLLPPAGDTLVSHDRGCSWSSAPSPLQGRRSVDLTVDPHDPARVLVVTSTVESIDERGLVTYDNALVETRDGAASWTELARLPSDFVIETLEIAASDPRRIYVSGTASASPLIGVIERSDDGGANWTRTTVDLPPTSGSLFISAIDPHDPDRLWVRVPAQGDRFGLFPASLLVSSDAGESFAMIAATSMGMLGLAVSPDGTQLAYGGPADGLLVGPSDGSGEFVRVSDLRVRCLRWTESGLYACGTEPNDPFSVGVSTDLGASFQPIYRMRDTCPQECASGTPFASRCEQPWSGIGPLITASGEGCAVPWAVPAKDAGAGIRDPGVPDAGATDAGAGRSDAASADASTPRAAGDAGGCGVGRGRAGASSGWSALACLLVIVAARTRRARGTKRRKRLCVQPAAQSRLHSSAPGSSRQV